MPFYIVKNDITRMQVDAIVNAANPSLAPQGGVCGAIFAAAGYEKMKQACQRIGHCGVGSAVETPAFDLPAKYVIHAVGPVWRGGKQNEAGLLASCVREALRGAELLDCTSVALPLISSGTYGYPRAEAMEVVVSTIRAFLDHRENWYGLEHFDQLEEGWGTPKEMHIYLVLSDREPAFLGKERYQKVLSYVQDHLGLFKCRRTEEASFCAQLAEPAEHSEGARPAAHPIEGEVPEKRGRSPRDLMNHREESFHDMLLRLIDERGMTDVEVYRRANIDRKLFSKVCRDGENPSKHTALALAIALRLNLDETKDLLNRAGCTLSHTSKFDVIVEYCVTEHIYNIDEVNEILFTFDQELLGARHRNVTAS